MNIFKKIRKIFNKTPTYKRLLIDNTRIRLIAKFNSIGARLINNNSYCSISSDCILILREEKEDKLIFEVRTNYLPSGFCDCHDKDVVYFNKKRFKTLKYIHV